MPELIPLYRPEVSRHDIETMTAALKQGKLSGGGWESRYEEMVAEVVGSRHAVAVTSASAGMLLLMIAIGVDAGDEVILSPINAVSTANAIELCGARPVFVDIDNASQGLNLTQLEEAMNDRTRLIITPQPQGLPAGVDRVVSLAQGREVPVIEEATYSLGTRYKGRALGAFGRAAVFSMSESAAINTGEGGVIVTDDDRLADQLRSQREAGRVQCKNHELVRPLNFPHFGFYFQMTTMQAALAISQMEHLPEIIRRREELACMYIDKLMELSELMMPKLNESLERVWPGFTLRLVNRYGQVSRDRIISGMIRHDIECAPGLACIHLQPYYKNKYMYENGDFPMSESCAARSLSLPFFDRMTGTHIELVGLTLKVMMQRENLLLDPVQSTSQDDLSDDEDALPRRDQ